MKIPGQSNGGIKSAWLPGRRATSAACRRRLRRPRVRRPNTNKPTRCSLSASGASSPEKTGTRLGRPIPPEPGGFISAPSRCQVHAAPFPHPSLPPHSIHQSCNPVVFAGRIRMCPWQRQKGKSTGIKFQRNCLLNCGLQLLKFYPRFCVTAAVMNSAWL